MSNDDAWNEWLTREAIAKRKQTATYLTERLAYVADNSALVEMVGQHEHDLLRVLMPEIRGDTQVIHTIRGKWSLPVSIATSESVPEDSMIALVTMRAVEVNYEKLEVGFDGINNILVVRKMSNDNR